MLDMLRGCSNKCYTLKQDIIRLPRLFRFLQRPLAQLISVLRAPKSKEGYASIGGGSPLRKITDDQVRTRLLTNGVVHIRMSSVHSHHPFSLLVSLAYVILDTL